MVVNSQGQQAVLDSNIAYTALVVTIQRGLQTTSVALINKAKLSVDVVGREGYTPLMWASRFGNIDMVKLLVAQGASVSKTNRAGEKAINIANKYGFRNIVVFLLSQGAKF